MKTKLKTLWLSTTLFALTGCAIGSTAPAVVSDYCRIAKPISFDTKIDSPETVAEIEEHNSKWVCVCENDCPKKPDATQPTP